MAELIKSAKTRYDIILVDAPSLSRHKDSQLIVGSTDSVCLVISEIETRRQAAKAAILPLVEKKTVFLGAILNKRIFPIPKWLYKKV
jgi:Mrp family chromosome partitioning ATPase